MRFGDKMPVITVIKNGVERALPAEVGATIMEILREHEMVLGTCGGMCSCGTCHVYVRFAPAPLDPPGEDERDMLEALAEVTAIDPDSRLSCQIEMRSDMTGMKVEIGLPL